MAEKGEPSWEVRETSNRKGGKTDREGDGEAEEQQRIEKEWQATFLVTNLNRVVNVQERWKRETVSGKRLMDRRLVLNAQSAVKVILGRNVKRSS